MMLHVLPDGALSGDEIELRLALMNIASYLRGTDPKSINFLELREQLATLEQQRDAIYFKQGSR